MEELPRERGTMIEIEFDLDVNCQCHCLIVIVIGDGSILLRALLDVSLTPGRYE